MLGFPFYTFGTFLLLFAVIGIAALSQGLYQLIKGSNKEEKEIFRSVMAILVGTIFFLVGSIFSIGIFWSTYKFRNINLSQVKGFRVIKYVDEYNKYNSRSITYENSQAVQDALRTLKNCSSTSRNHETYQDGYKLQIIFTDENVGQDLNLSVYRKSNNTSRKSVVIPHYYEIKNLNLGEFNCPEFQDWVRKNIDPLFQNK